MSNKVLAVRFTAIAKVFVGFAGMADKAPVTMSIPDCPSKKANGHNFLGN
jgi:hypothetical protein